MRWFTLLLITLCSLQAEQARAQKGCCFSEPRQSLLDRYLNAPILVAGRFQNAVEPNNALPNGQSELVLDDILVPHDVLKGRKTILVPRTVLTKGKFLVAMEIYKGQLDAYHGTEIDDKGEVVKYVRGALKLKNKSLHARLCYSVDFLQSPDTEVAACADLELRRASYPDFRKVAESLKPESLVKAIQDSKTAGAQRGTLGMLLGHCGKKEHAALLRKMINAPAYKAANHLQELMVGYVLLDPEGGWEFVANIATLEKIPFMKRYCAFTTMRQIGDDRPDLIGAKKYAAGIARILDVPDLADFAIENLRKQKRWEFCDAILELHGKKGFKNQMISKAVLRFALQCPTPAAKTFVTIERSKDADGVLDVEELLGLEKEDVVGPKK
jgi:hypothetical protein